MCLANTYEQKDLDYVTDMGSLTAGGQQYQSTDAFLLAQAQWLDNYLTTRSTNPIWTIVYMHLSPFTCVRTKRCQVFVSVFEKHKIPLVLCGHNHLYTRSIPIYSGYPTVTEAGVIPAYNTYYDFPKKATTKYVDENTAPNVSGGTGINHTADTHNGYDYNVNGYSDGRVWWNAVSNTVKVPGYLTLEITDTQIVGKFYQIQGAKSLQNYNGTNYEYAPNIEDLSMTRSLLDTFTINKSDRT